MADSADEFVTGWKQGSVFTLVAGVIFFLLGLWVGWML